MAGARELITTRRQLRVLLVDDDDNYATLVRRALDAMDLDLEIDLVHVDDGDVALDYLLGHEDYADRVAHPMPDVVLLDERMPRMDGSDVLEALHAHGGAKRFTLPIICHMTFGPNPKLVNQCYAQGATFCVTKPMKYELMVEKLTIMMQFFTRVLELPGTNAVR